MIANATNVETRGSKIEPDPIAAAIQSPPNTTSTACPIQPERLPIMKTFNDIFSFSDTWDEGAKRHSIVPQSNLPL